MSSISSMIGRLTVCGAILATACHAGGARAGRAAAFLDSLPHWPVEQVARIDGNRAQLSPISWMGQAPDGTLAVIQPDEQDVRFFDASGEGVGRFGRQGNGPGEFERLVRGGWVGDTLWVSDARLDRVTLIASGRTLVRVLPPLLSLHDAPGDTISYPSFEGIFPYAVYPGDTMLVDAYGSASDPRYAAAYGGGTPYLRVGPRGAIEKLVAVPDMAGSTVIIHRPDGGESAYRIPFYPRPREAVAPDGSRVASVVTSLGNGRSGTYTVRESDERGRKLFERSFPFDGVRIPGHVADSVIEALAARDRQPGGSRVWRTQVRGRIPPVYPPVEGLLLDTRGRTWIGLRRTGQGMPWLVLDPAGEPTAVVVLPAGARLSAVARDRLWAIETDSLGVPSILGYRVEAGR